MSANWIKVEAHLPGKPEVFRMSKIVGQNRHEIVGRLLGVWSWLNQISSSGELVNVSRSDIDDIAGHQGFAAAMHQVGWLAGEDGALQVPKWERHNGNSAKARALEAEAKRLRRLADELSDICPTILATNVGPDESRREETRGEKEISSRKDRSDDRKEQPSGQSSRSTLDFSSGGEEPLDLSGVDWREVTMLAESAAKRVRPLSTADRRAWLKYAVMACTSFSEAWLAGASESAALSGDVKKSRQALFVRSLQVSASEMHGTPKDVFDVIFKRINIPLNIWKSDVLKPRAARSGNASDK